MNEERLKKIIEDLMWLAARYSHGRHTYAPGIVRNAVKEMTRMYPEWKVKPDSVIEPPKKDYIGLRSDYLDDIFFE